jgi:hypothetical protein
LDVDGPAGVAAVDVEAGGAALPDNVVALPVTVFALTAPLKVEAEPEPEPEEELISFAKWSAVL